jgi:hypothetical protein
MLFDGFLLPFFLLFFPSGILNLLMGYRLIADRGGGSGKPAAVIGPDQVGQGGVWIGLGAGRYEGLVSERIFLAQPGEEIFSHLMGAVSVDTFPFHGFTCCPE